MKYKHLSGLAMMTLIIASQCLAITINKFPLPPNTHPSRQDLPSPHKQSAMPDWATCADGKSDCLAINIRHSKPNFWGRTEENGAVLYFNFQHPESSQLLALKKHEFAFIENKTPATIDDQVSDSRLGLTYISELGKQWLQSWLWKSEQSYDGVTVKSLSTTMTSTNFTAVPDLPSNVTLPEISFLNNQTRYELQLFSNKQPLMRNGVIPDFTDTSLQLYLFDEKTGKTSKFVIPEDAVSSDANEVIAINKPGSTCITLNYGNRQDFSYDNNVYEYCPVNPPARKVAESAYRLSCSLNKQRTLEVDIHANSVTVTDGNKPAKPLLQYSGLFNLYNMRSRPWLTGESCQLANVEHLDCLLSVDIDDSDQVTQIGCLLNHDFIDYLQQKTGLFLGTAVWLGPSKTIGGLLRIPLLVSHDNQQWFELVIVSLTAEEALAVQQLALQ